MHACSQRGRTNKALRLVKRLTKDSGVTKKSTSSNSNSQPSQLVTRCSMARAGSPARSPRTSSAILTRQHTSEYVSIHHNTSAYVSGCGIRQRPHLLGNTASFNHHTLAMLGSHAMKHLDVASAALHLRRHCCALPRRPACTPHALKPLLSLY